VSVAPSHDWTHGAGTVVVVVGASVVVVVGASVVVVVGASVVVGAAVVEVDVVVLEVGWWWPNGGVHAADAMAKPTTINAIRRGRRRPEWSTLIVASCRERILPMPCLPH
jgi:hypothetical protein